MNNIIFELHGQSLVRKNKSIKSLLDDSFRRFHGRTVIETIDSSMTYQELCQRSIALSNVLSENGAKAGDVIGVNFGRDTQSVVAVVAILYLGGIYLPLDDSLPKERMRYIVEDSGMKFVLTNKDSFDFSSLACVIQYSDHYLPEKVYLSSSSIVNENLLAYMFYTSGTTGRPKGVLVSQKSLLNSILAFDELLAPNIDDRFLLLSNISFDISLLEIFLPISTGGRISILSKSAYSDHHVLIDEIKRLNVNVIQATPSEWRLLLECGFDISTQRKIICGGEQLSSNLAKRLLEKSKGFWNMYGPTEATIWTAAKYITCYQSISIGKPISNTSLFILGQKGSRRGELCVAGCGLAEGYHGNNSLTAEKFVNLDLSDGRRVSIYRTGDFVSFDTSSDVIYIGRIDRQIKLNGHRIELQEIERVAQREHLIEKCHVVPVSVGGDINHMLLFYTINTFNNLPDSEIPTIIRHKLTYLFKSNLPRYMHPVEYRHIKSFPLTPNRKIDFEKLKGLVDSKNIESFNKTFTPSQARLVKLWINILNRSSVNISDRFSLLGGHSLLAAKLASAIRREFEISFTISDVIKNDIFSDMLKLIYYRVDENATSPR